MDSGGRGLIFWNEGKLCGNEEVEVISPYLVLNPPKFIAVMVAVGWVRCKK